MIRFLLDSRVGRAIRTLRGNAIMSESFGVNTRRLRVQVFVFAALLAAVSGWLYAHMQRFVNPTPFGLHVGIEYLFMAVVGGVGYVWGALLGAALVTALKQVLQSATATHTDQWPFGHPVRRAAGGNAAAGHGGVWAWCPTLRRPPPARRPPAATALASRPRLATDGPLLEVRGAQGVRRAGGGERGELTCPGEIVGLIDPTARAKHHVQSSPGCSIHGRRNTLPRAVDRRHAAEEIARLGIARTFQHATAACAQHGRQRRDQCAPA
jgi:branched-chain amino acid transport system permease protein